MDGLSLLKKAREELCVQFIIKQDKCVCFNVSACIILVPRTFLNSRIKRVNLQVVIGGPERHHVVWVADSINP